MKNWRIPDHMIPEGDVWLGDPEPEEKFSCKFVKEVELPVPRGFDSWREYLENDAPYHPYRDLPGEPNPEDGIPERVYLKNPEWWHPAYDGVQGGQR